MMIEHCYAFDVCLQARLELLNSSAAFAVLAAQSVPSISATRIQEINQFCKKSNTFVLTHARCYSAYSYSLRRA